MDSVTFTISTDDGDEDSLTVPAEALEMVAEDDQPPAQTLGDVAMLSIANRAHHLAHHGDGGDGVEAVEQATMEAFEDRFGMTFAEATGHSH